MTNRSQLHIIVPGLCGPLAETQSLSDNPEFVRWAGTLAASRCLSQPGNLHDVLAAIFRLEIENDFPSAALSLLASDLYKTGTHAVFADPVHMQADMDHAILTSSDDLDVTSDESSILCDELNRHFRQDGLQFTIMNPQQWVVSTADEIKLITTPLSEAVGRNINFILPGGDHAPRWNKLLTEAQMIMFAHEVNSVRENTGQLDINGLWLHGSGGLSDIFPAESDTSDCCICSDQLMLKGLADVLEYDFMSLPETAAAYFEYLSSSNNASLNVLHLSALEQLVNYADVRPWSEKSEEILKTWIYPLLRYAGKNDITIKLYPCNGKSYLFSKYDNFCFWRKLFTRVKIEQYVDSY